MEVLADFLVVQVESVECTSSEKNMTIRLYYDALLFIVRVQEFFEVFVIFLVEIF